MERLRFIIMFSTLILVPAVASAQDNFDPTTYKADGPMPYFNSQAFQSGIRSPRDIGVLAKQYSPLQDKASTFGFSAKSDEARFFLIGAIYTEALAYVASGKWELASQRLDYLGGEFVKMGAPSALYGFITKVRNMIDESKYPPDYLVTVLSLFQPFFEEYAKAGSDDKLTLFRTGAWLVNMSLTAAAGDRELLRQAAALNYFSSELKRMDAPKGVIDALAEMNTISSKAEITDKDAQRVLQLVTEIEQLLS